MRFEELRLAEPIVRAVAAEGYASPSPIQAEAIPSILAGHDVLGCAQTGTGKTGAFALPILHRLADGGSRHGRAPRGLVLCPTRELATQIHERFDVYGRFLALRHGAIFGGVSQRGQERVLRAGVDVLVATPGRLLDLLEQGLVDLGSIEVLVLDEADRMLDMGFIRDIRKIIDRVPSERQTLLFSATMPGEIRRLADAILREPVRVQVDPAASAAGSIAQSVYLVSRAEKPGLLGTLLSAGVMGRTLVFSRTKHGADKLVKVLRHSGVEAAAIHGNKSQNARTRALDAFKSGRVPVLVATDIASRGIDVEQITHVINFDLPNEAETYVHRIGRTARAGASGIAISFCDHDEIGDLRAIERLIGMKLDVARNDLGVSVESGATHGTRRSGDKVTSRGGKGRSRSRRSRAPGGEPGGRSGRVRKPTHGGSKHRGRSRATENPNNR